MYPNMTQFMPFYFDIRGFYQNDKSFMITGKHLAYLTCLFNSYLFCWAFKDNFPKLGDNGRELRKIFFDKIPALEVSDQKNQEFEELVNDIQNNYSIEKAQRIDTKIFELYGLSEEEQKAIGYIEIE